MIQLDWLVGKQVRTPTCSCGLAIGYFLLDDPFVVVASNEKIHWCNLRSVTILPTTLPPLEINSTQIV